MACFDDNRQQRPVGPDPPGVVTRCLGKRVKFLAKWPLQLRDGRWRQFESLDCIDIDSVHIDFQREIPYVLFYPDLVENVMRAWAKYQSDDGHIVEALAAGCYSPTRKIDRCV